MAARGIAYEKIVEHYFPGVRLLTDPVNRAGKPASGSRVEQDAVAAGTRAAALDLIPAAPPPELITPARTSRIAGTRVISSEHFRVQYSGSSDEADARLVLGILEQARVDIQRRLGSAFPSSIERRPAEVAIHSTTQEFVAATGQPWWAAAATGNGRIDLQPAGLLKRKKILPRTLRHELAHLVIDAMNRGGTPRWLAEGLAIHIAGEGPALSRGVRQINLTTDELERRIRVPSSLGEMRALYYAAYLKVRKMIAEKGEAAVWRDLARGR
jgi:hypothetical protein